MQTSSYSAYSLSHLLAPLRRVAAGLLFVSFLGGVPVTLPACAPKSVTSTPARAAYTAEQAALRVGELQRAVIAASNENKIPLADAREIVTLISGDVRAVPPRTGLLDVLASTPEGWKATAQSSWQVLRAKVERVPALSLYVPMLDGVIGGL